MFKRLPLRGLLLSFAVGLPVLAAIPGDSLILAILGISFLIFVHEWGHFYACRLTGTRTETFSIGFGPRLFGWEKSRDGERRFTVGSRQLDPADHAMDFRVAAIPLGGYVKMAGELPGEAGDGGGKPLPDEFPAKSAWARSFIICAGVIMNFITAAIFYTICIAGEKAFTPPIAGHVTPGGGAWHAGMEPGDRILNVNGNTTPTFIDLRMEIAFASDSEDATVFIERDGKALDPIQIAPQENEEQGILVFGVIPPARLDFSASEDADAAFSIGPVERAKIAGLPVRGGAQAAAALGTAIAAGLVEIRVEKEDGSSFDYAVPVAAEPPEAPAQKPTPKIGIEPFGHPVVKATRAPASTHFRAGDELVSATIGEKRLPLESLSDVQALLFRTSLDRLEVLRDGERRTMDVAAKSQAEVATLLRAMHLDVPEGNRIKPFPAGRLTMENGLYRYPSSPAVEAGIPAGARLKRIGDRVIDDWADVRSAAGRFEAGTPVPVTIQIEGQPEEVRELTPVELAYVGEPPWTAGEVREHWQSDGLGDAFIMGVQRMGRETKNVFRTIGSLFAGTISFNKNIAGPITLVRASKRFAESGPLKLLWFLAYVSVMLAVLNILPIPVLDGGHLMFIIIEQIKGAPLKEETMFRFQKVGMILLLVLMFFAFKNDFTRLLF